MIRYLKDPAARLDYTVDWTDWLALHEADVIATSTWTAAPEGIVLGTATVVDGVATVWASGGTLGREYVLTNQITTVAGRVDERSVRLLIEDR